MDKVFVKGLRVETVIGVYDWERTIKQSVIFDLIMKKDLRAAASTDDLQNTLDYKVVTDRITEYVEQTEFQLIESLAESVAELIQKEFGVEWLELTLTKPDAISKCEGVGIVIERGTKVPEVCF